MSETLFNGMEFFQIVFCIRMAQEESLVQPVSFSSKFSKTAIWGKQGVVHRCLTLCNLFTFAIKWAANGQKMPEHKVFLWWAAEIVKIQDL